MIGKLFIGVRFCSCMWYVDAQELLSVGDAQHTVHRPFYPAYLPKTFLHLNCPYLLLDIFFEQHSHSMLIQVIRLPPLIHKIQRFHIRDATIYMLGIARCLGFFTNFWQQWSIIKLRACVTSIAFFPWIRRRASYLCIIERKNRPLTITTTSLRAEPWGVEFYMNRTYSKETRERWDLTQK